jgi:hypothetical protein
VSEGQLLKPTVLSVRGEDAGLVRPPDH